MSFFIDRVSVYLKPPTSRKKRWRQIRFRTCGKRSKQPILTVVWIIWLNHRRWWTMTLSYKYENKRSNTISWWAKNRKPNIQIKNDKERKRINAYGSSSTYSERSNATLCRSLTIDDIIDREASIIKSSSRRKRVRECVWKCWNVESREKTDGRLWSKRNKIVNGAYRRQTSDDLTRCIDDWNLFSVRTSSIVRMISLENDWSLKMAEKKVRNDSLSK